MRLDAPFTTVATIKKLKQKMKNINQNSEIFYCATHVYELVIENLNDWELLARNNDITFKNKCKKKCYISASMLLQK